ncbi:hypothetical protein [Luteimonas sp. A478]
MGAPKRKGAIVVVAALDHGGRPGSADGGLVCGRMEAMMHIPNPAPGREKQ